MYKIPEELTVGTIVANITAEDPDDNIFPSHLLYSITTSSSYFMINQCKSHTHTHTLVWGMHFWLSPSLVTRITGVVAAGGREGEGIEQNPVSTAMSPFAFVEISFIIQDWIHG